MRVILKEDIFNIGKEGDEINVKDGFARSYLLPKGIAVFASKHNLEIFRQKKRAILKRQETKIEEANQLKAKLSSLKLEFLMRSNDNEKLFHSINSLNISEELAKLGFKIERKKIDVPRGSLKSFGVYDVLIKIYENISALIKVEIKEEFKKHDNKENKGDKAKVGINETKKKLKSKE